MRRATNGKRPAGLVISGRTRLVGQQEEQIGQSEAAGETTDPPIPAILVTGATATCVKPSIATGADAVYPASVAARNISRNYGANPAVYLHQHHGRQIKVQGKIWRIRTTTEAEISNDWWTMQDHRMICAGLP